MGGLLGQVVAEGLCLPCQEALAAAERDSSVSTHRQTTHASRTCAHTLPQIFPSPSLTGRGVLSVGPPRGGAGGSALHQQP